MTAADIMICGVIIIATLILSFIAQRPLAFQFGFQISYISTVATSVVVLSPGYSSWCLVRELLTRFDAWLRTCVEQTLKQTFVTTDQLAEAKHSIIAQESLNNTLSEYVTTTELSQRGFVSQTEFAVQLDQHFNSSGARQGHDERFKGLSKKTKERCEGITKTIGNLSAEIDTKINRMLHSNRS